MKGPNDETWMFTDRNLNSTTYKPVDRDLSFYENYDEQ